MSADDALPPPARADVPYGPHAHNTLDFWPARGARGTRGGGPSPLLVVLHGAGGDKREYAEGEHALIQACLDAGISVASVDYRLSAESPYPAPMRDGARAVQFLRARAGEWGLDATRVAATGRSAGAGIALWLGFHADLADPADDVVSRQSTRLRCLLVRNAQTSYDPRFIRRHIPGAAWRHPALTLLFGLDERGLADPPPEKVAMIEDASPITHLRADAPPVFMTYKRENDPLTDSASAGRGIHHPTFGILLKERMDALGLRCTVHSGVEHFNTPAELAFLSRHLGEE